MLTNRDVLAGLTEGFSTRFADADIDFGNPDKFDPENSDMESWIWISVPSVQMTATRKGAPQHGSFRLEIICAARIQTNLYAAAELAATVHSLVDHWTTPIKDFRSLNEPVVGLARCKEPETMDETSDNDLWQRKRVSVEGWIDEIL